ncbi:nuclear transport factor 2 family protein [Tautonia marina]|uniref:nuclear transport factor 2 family protein n=1 Tax=Tautonia marina TaxID=2653855 RepID=UPI0012607166|nr:nuclear transport factor 2 family protein [Tautonia marina]
MESPTTREVAETWFEALTTGQIDRAIACLADDVEWINYTPVPGLNDIMPWIGTYHGVQAVMDSFLLFTSLVQVKREELVRLAVDGENAAGVIYELSTVKETGLDFEIEFIQWLTIRGGKIVRWKSYTDPSPIIVAMRGSSPSA